MPRSARYLLCSLALSLLSACSLVVDFPTPREEGEKRDASVDAGKGDSGKGDAAADGGERDADAEDPIDAGSDCTLDSHGGCEKDELCCDRKDGEGASCVSTSANECSVCGEACIDPKAPHCGGRVCECRQGSGEGCPGKQTCMGTGAEARCVECATRAECGDNELCVDNKCVQCSRGANAGDSADDEGCSGNTPICGANNSCVACSASPNNCPNPDKQQCVGGVGCVGCNPDVSVPLDQSGCPRSTPICKPASGMFQCFGCEANSDCRGGFCDRATGTCTNVCDPQAAIGANVCASGKPFCKRVGNDFACVACAAADCTDGRFCAVEAPQAGNCVQCRNNADCPEAAPSCNRTTGTCSGCAAPRPVFDNATGQCVECATDANCAGSATTPYCHPTRKECVACNALPMPDMACTTRNMNTPRCGPSGLCTGCMSDMPCSTATPATPFCVSGTCSACTAVTPAATADSRCAMISPATRACVASGRCAGCDPADDSGCVAPAGQCDAENFACVTCIPSRAAALDEGCGNAAPDCISFPGVGPTCVACDPNNNAQTDRCGGRVCVLTPPTATCTPPGQGDAGTGGGPGPGIGIGIGPIEVTLPL